MSKKISTKTIQYSVYDKTSGKNKYVGDTTTYTRPDIEMQTDGFSGAGIMGEIDLPTLGQLAGMEGELAFNKTTEEMVALFTPTAHTIEVRWVTNTLNTATGDIEVQANKEIVKFLPKSISLGDIEGNETNEASMTYEILSYQYLIAGKTVIKIDKLNNVFIVNGVDYSAKIRNLL